MDTQGNLGGKFPCPPPLGGRHQPDCERLAGGLHLTHSHVRLAWEKLFCHHQASGSVGCVQKLFAVPIPCLPHAIPIKSLVGLGAFDRLDWSLIHCQLLLPQLPQMIDMLLLFLAPNLPSSVPHSLMYFLSEFLNILSRSVSALRYL